MRSRDKMASGEGERVKTVIWRQRGQIETRRAGIKTYSRDFPGGPVVKTLYSQCRGPGFNPWSGNYVPHTTTKDLACHN